MIAILALAGLTCFMFVGLWVGARLLLLARRTRQLPEMLVGASLFLSGGLGLALSIAAAAIPSLTPAESFLAVRLAIVVNALGFQALYVFVWVVFRRDALWGKLVFAACSLMLLVGTVGELMTREPGGQNVGPEFELGPFAILSIVSRLFGYFWASAESLNYHAMMKRRLAIGLAEESLVARFWYWGVGMSASFLIWVLTLVNKVFVDAGIESEIPTVVAAVLGFVVAAAIHQSFFPKDAEEASAGESMADATSPGST